MKLIVITIANKFAVQSPGLKQIILQITRHAESVALSVLERYAVFDVIIMLDYPKLLDAYRQIAIWSIGRWR
jgi:hypothetical protein